MYKTQKKRKRLDTRSSYSSTSIENGSFLSCSFLPLVSIFPPLFLSISIFFSFPFRRSSSLLRFFSICCFCRFIFFHWLMFSPISNVIDPRCLGCCCSSGSIPSASKVVWPIMLWDFHDFEAHKKFKPNPKKKGEAISFQVSSSTSVFTPNSLDIYTTIRKRRRICLNHGHLLLFVDGLYTTKKRNDSLVAQFEKEIKIGNGSVERN